MILEELKKLHQLENFMNISTGMGIEPSDMQELIEKEHSKIKDTVKNFLEISKEFAEDDDLNDHQEALEQIIRIVTQTQDYLRGTAKARETNISYGLFKPGCGLVSTTGSVVSAGLCIAAMGQLVIQIPHLSHKLKCTSHCPQQHPHQQQAS